MFSLIDFVLRVYAAMIIIRAILSWFSPNYGSPIVQFLIRATEPVLSLVRRILPPMRIDISPLIVLFIIELIRNQLYRALFRPF